MGRTLRVSPSEGDWGDSSHYVKNCLVPHVPRCFAPKNVDFVIFMQILAILPKISQVSQVDSIGQVFHCEIKTT